MSIPVFTPLDSVQFTFVSSVAPDSAPIFKVTGIGNTVINSITSTQSNTTNYYTVYTMPTSEGFYIGEWYAVKTVIGSAYSFVKKFLWQVKETTTP